MASSPVMVSSVSERERDDGELKLLVPVHDVPDPELSIVIPALNEELTILLTAVAGRSAPQRRVALNAISTSDQASANGDTHFCWIGS